MSTWDRQTGHDAASRDRSHVITYANRGLHGQLVESLGARIVQGEIVPGEIIDVDQLGVDRDVSRTVVREAVKALIAKRLLDARPKYGTFVRERDEWNLLDPDVIRWRQVAGPDPRLLRELMEIRLILEPMTTRLAAERGEERHMQALEAAFERLSSADEDHVEADLHFHRVLASASGNELLERLIIMLEPVQRMRDEVAYQAKPEDVSYVDAHRRVFESVRARNADAAEQAMRALVETARSDTEAAIGPMSDAS